MRVLDAQTMLDRMNDGEGVLTLAMAESPFGILRDMKTRCDLQHEPRTRTLARAKLVKDTILFEIWVLYYEPKGN